MPVIFTVIVNKKLLTDKNEFRHKKEPASNEQNHCHKQALYLELIPRFELGTSSLPRMRSTD